MGAPNAVPSFEEYQQFIAARNAGLQNAEPTAAEVAQKPTIADVLKAVVNSARFASEATVRLYHEVIDEWHAERAGKTTDANQDGIPDKYETDTVPAPAPEVVPNV